MIVRRPGSYRRLELEETKDPVAGDGEVLIRVGAIGVNYADCIVRMGYYSSAKVYEGWPITVSQLDNGFPGEGLTLGTIESPDVSDPVIQVIDQSNGEIVYSLRIQGKSFEPKVRRAGLYTVKVLEPDQGYEKVYQDLRAKRP